MRDDRPEILGVLRAYHAAMVGARTDDLERLLAADYSLVHITGYEQPKREWFGVIRSGQFDYHRIDVDEQSLSVHASGGSAVLMGRGIFNATINGMRSPWQLQFTMQLAKRSDEWLVAQARYQSY